MTWGHALFGTDNSAVQDQLRMVQRIQASSFALAAILAAGFVVNDSSAVQDRLLVQHTQASSFAFDAILADGSV